MCRTLPVLVPTHAVAYTAVYHYICNVSSTRSASAVTCRMVVAGSTLRDGFDGEGIYLQAAKCSLAYIVLAVLVQQGKCLGGEECN